MTDLSDTPGHQTAQRVEFKKKYEIRPLMPVTGQLGGTVFGTDDLPLAMRHAQWLTNRATELPGDIQEYVVVMVSLTPLHSFKRGQE